jgi:LysM repeat protein
MRRSSLLVVMLLALAAAGCGEVVRRPEPTPTATAAIETVRLATPPLRPTSTAVALPTLMLPLATPLPTATPVVYVVRAGDTLIGIARQYDLSVDAIQAANNNVAPELLQIGQELVIPQPTASGPIGPDRYILPTPTPLPLELAGLSFRETAVGSLWLLGEVRNPTDMYVDHVAVRVSLTDAEGKEIDGGLVYTALDPIPPGSSSPFGLLFPGRPPGLAGFRATLASAEPAAALGDRATGLTVAEHKGGPAGALYRVTGQVHNTSDAAVNEVRVVVTLYDAEGALTGFRAETLNVRVEPGAMAAFDVRATIGGGNTVRYSVAAQGRRAGEG